MRPHDYYIYCKIKTNFIDHPLDNHRILNTNCLYQVYSASDSVYYFFMEDPALTSPGTLGKASMYADPSKFVLEKFILTKPVTVLRSTLDLASSPGATQVFSTQVEKASSSEVIKKF